MNELDLQTYIATLFGNIPETSLIEFRPIKDNHVEPHFYKVSELDKLADNIRSHEGKSHCFVGVLPRGKTLGTDDAVSAIQTFWVDIDAKQFKGSNEDHKKEQCLHAINTFPLKPTLIVDSGNGYHAYWLLKSAIRLESAEDRNEMLTLSRALHKTIGADATFNLSRILRVPGTSNIKDKDNPKKARIISTNLISKYTLDDIKSNVDMDLGRDTTENLRLDDHIGFNTLAELSKIVPVSILDRAKTCPHELLSDRSANDFWVAIKLFETGLNDSEVVASFKLFAEAGWASGDKVKRGTDYLIKHTLPQAKAKAYSLEKVLERIKEATTDTDKFALVDKALEGLIPMGAIEQAVYLKKIHSLLGGVKEISLGTLKNRLKYLRAIQGPGRFFEISSSGASTFLPHLLGSHLLNKDSYMFLNSTLYRYESGVFRSDGIEHASTMIQGLLESIWKPNYRDETIEWLKDKTYTPPESLENEEFGYLINCKNGMLDVRSRVLLPHSPDYKSTMQITATFDASATCPRLEQFTEEVFNEDAIKTLWEFNGYVLAGALELKRFLILVGSGNNGKSVWLNIINHIIGDTNVVNEPLQKLANNNFSTSNLFGKMANINADLESDAVKYTGIIKMLTGGDKISAEVKYGDTFYFRNRARLLFSCNDLPPIIDYNDAYFERLLVVNCPNQFSADQVDPHLFETLISEDAKSAWLNLALEGIERILGSKRFTASESISKDTLQYRYSNDTVSEFINSNILASDGDFIPKDELYEIYKNWCRSVGRYPCSLKIFTRRAQKDPCNLIQYHPKKDDKQITAWKDVKLGDIANYKFGLPSNEKGFNLNIKNN